MHWLNSASTVLVRQCAACQVSCMDDSSICSRLLRKQSRFLFLPQVHDASPRVITQALALDVRLGQTVRKQDQQKAWLNCHATSSMKKNVRVKRHDYEAQSALKRTPSTIGLCVCVSRMACLG